MPRARQAHGLQRAAGDGELGFEARERRAISHLQRVMGLDRGEVIRLAGVDEVIADLDALVAEVAHGPGEDL